MASAVNKILSGNGKLIQVVSGKDDGEDAWHCVLVNKSQFEEFQKNVTNDDVAIDSFGKIIKSGWGTAPSEQVLRALAAEYI